VVSDLITSRKIFVVEKPEQSTRKLIGAVAARFLVEMKKFALVLLLVAAVGYYFGIDPTDFLPTVPQSDAARDRVRHAPAAPEQTPGAQPAASAAITPIANSSDGSLANRWQPSPSPSPKKP